MHTQTPPPSIVRYICKLMNQHWHTIINQSPWFTLGLVLCVVHCLGFNKCTMTDIHNYNIQNSFIALNICCAPPIHPSLPPSLWQSLIFFFNALHSFAFSRISYYGIIIYFSDWLLSLSDMFLRFFHAFLWHDSSFLFCVK